MECALATLIACFSWSNLYIDTQFNLQDRTVPYHYWRDISPPPRDGVIETAFVSTISDRSDNPYLRSALGFELSFRQVDLSAEIFHDSSIATSRDRGVNGIGLRARWFPFR